MRRLAILLVRFYQRFLSPLKPPTCRFRPTCSNYAIEAYGKRSFLAATWFVIARLARCHPLARGGFDPVPERGFRPISDEARLLDPPGEHLFLRRWIARVLVAALLVLLVRACWA